MEEVRVPEISPGDVLVEMKMCGLCGTDIEKLRGEYTASTPTLGHEPVGIVCKVGAGVKRVVVGDRIFAHHHVPCSTCYFCKKGSETMCLDYRKTNLDPSGFAEYFRIPAINVTRGAVLKLPDNVSFDEGIFIEPMACCVRGLRKIGVSKGDSIFIAGAGPIGLTFLQLSFLMGVSGTYVSDLSPLRRRRAKTLGASAILNPRKDTVASEVKKSTEGRGVDVAVVASASPEALVNALDSVRKGGRVLLFGLPAVGAQLAYDLSELVNREIDIISSNAATEIDTNRALKYMKDKKIDVSSLLTHKFTLDQFDMAVGIVEKGEAVKVSIIP